MNPTLLLVDDEPAITDAIETSLLDEHYTIYKAGCAAEALSVLEQHAITVVITDQFMPGMSGTDLCALVHQRWPTTYRILLSSQNEIKKGAPSPTGDIHQYLAKPWDAMLLRYNINEGIRQQKILAQALSLRSSFQQLDQACLVTDKNWVIQLVNASAAEWLSSTTRQLAGKNLFSNEISTNSIQQETQLINILESQAHWQGSFHLNTNSIHGSEAWMCIVPFGEQHYLCLAIPMIDDMLNELSSNTNNITNTSSHAAETSGFRYLKIVIDHNNKLNLDFITVVNERLQLACDNLYQIIATNDGDHIIQLPAHLRPQHRNNILANIHQIFIQPLLFHGRECLIGWHSEDMQQPDLNPVQRPRKDAQKQKYQGHSYFQPQQYAHTGFSCLPIFDQHGQAIALMPPACQQREDIEQWLKDALYCSREWQRYSSNPIHWLNDFSELKPHKILRALGAIVSLQKQSGQEQNRWWLILTPEQLTDIPQADDHIQQQLEDLETKLLMKNPDVHLNRIKEFHRQLPSLFAGLCIESPWLFDNQQQIKRHSMQLLNHLKNQDLLIMARNIETPQQLACLHESPCHWLAGEMLSVNLLPQQVSWLHQ